MNELNNLLNSVPHEVQFDHVAEFDGLDDQISTVGLLYANTIKVADEYIEFCPDNDALSEVKNIIICKTNYISIT